MSAPARRRPAIEAPRRRRPRPREPPAAPCPRASRRPTFQPARRQGARERAADEAEPEEGDAHGAYRPARGRALRRAGGARAPLTHPALAGRRRPGVVAAGSAGGSSCGAPPRAAPGSSGRRSGGSGAPRRRAIRAAGRVDLAAAAPAGEAGHGAILRRRGRPDRGAVRPDGLDRTTERGRAGPAISRRPAGTPARAATSSAGYAWSSSAPAQVSLVGGQVEVPVPPG